MVLRRHIFLVLFLSALFLTIPISTSAQDEPDCDLDVDLATYANQGMEAANAGDFEAALLPSQCAVAVDPNSSVAHSNFGYVLAQLERNDEALAAYAEALRLDPENIDALKNRGQLYANLGQNEDALADYTAAVEIAPAADLYLSLGILHFRLEDFEAAEADFTSAMEMDSTEPLYPRNRAAARFSLQRYDEAYEDFALANQLAPDWEVPVFGMADALYSAGRYDDSLATYRDGISRFGSSESRDNRLRRISIIRSGDMVDSRTPPSSGAITANTAAALIPVSQFERESTTPIVEEAVNPDGQLLTIADADGVVTIYDADHTLVTELDLGSSVKNLTASPDSTLIALIADNSRIVLISSGSQAVYGELGSENTSNASLEGIAFSPDSALLAAVWSDGTIRIYDPVLLLPVGVFTQSDTEITAQSGVGFSPNGRYLAVAVNESSAQLWDILEGTLATTWSGAEEAIHTITFNPAGDRLYGASDQALYYWNSDGDAPRVTRIEMNAPLTDLHFSPDDQLIAVAADSITIFDAATMDVVAELDGSASWSTVIFSPDGDSIIASQATETTSAVIVLEPLTATLEVDVTDFAPITAENAASLEMIAEMPLNEPRGVIWSEDGDTLFVGSNTGILSFPLDGDSASFSQQPRGTFALLDGSPIYQAVVNGADGEQTLIAYDVEDFDEPILEYEADDLSIRSFVFGDELIALATPAADGRLIPGLLRLPLDGSEPESIAAGGTEALNGIAVRGDGVSAAAVRDPNCEMVCNPSISFYEADGSDYATINAPIPFINLVGEIQLGFVMNLAFSPDGSLIAAIGSPDVLRIWQEVAPGEWQAVENIEPPGGSSSTSFSPSGEWLVSRGNEEVVIWHIEQAEGERTQITEAARLPVAASAVQGSIRFNADDTLLAIVTSDNMVQIWGIEL